MSNIVRIYSKFNERPPYRSCERVHDQSHRICPL